MRVKQTLFRLLAVFMGIALFFSADYAARQAYLALTKSSHSPNTGEAYPKFPRIPHPIYHHGLKAMAQGWDFYGPRQTEYFSNSLGMRDGSTRKVQAAATGPRVLFIGDSFAEGIGVAYENTYAGLLASRWAAAGVEVLNGAVSSFCPTIILARLRNLLLDEKLSVNEVVLFLDISDIKDELFYEGTPDGRVRPVPYGPLRERATQLERIDRYCSWLESHVEQNFVLLGALVRNLRLTLRRHGPVNGIRAFEMMNDWANAWPDYQGPYTGFIEQGLAKAKLEMKGIRDFLNERQIPLSLVIYPWPQQIRAGTRPSRAEREWLEWCRQEQVPCLNLFPLFVSDTPADRVLSTYFIPGDCHWNEAGHRLVADALQKFLAPTGFPVLNRVIDRPSGRAQGN